MHLRQEHFLLPTFQLTHRVFNDRVPTREPPLVSQTPPDLQRRVPLLPRQPLVRLQDFADPFQIRPDLRLRGFPTPLVPRRLAVRQHLLQRRPVHPRLTQDLTLRNPFHQHPTPNRHPLVHVAVHSRSSMRPHGRPTASKAIGQSRPVSQSSSRGAALSLRPAARRSFAPPFTRDAVWVVLSWPGRLDTMRQH